MLLNESEAQPRSRRADSLPLRDAFAVLFFVSVGMLFDPRSWSSSRCRAGDLAIIVFGKSLRPSLDRARVPAAAGTALTISASLAQIGEFSFILAGLGVTEGLLPQRRARPGPGRRAALDHAQSPAVQWPRIAQRGVTGATPTATAESPPGPRLEGENHTIVVGYGRVGRELSALLRQRGVPVLVVDDDPDLIARAHAEGFAAVRGNAAADRVLAETQAERACIAAVAIPNALEAGEVVAKLRALNPALVVFARAHGEAELKHLLEHGADGAVLAERELAHSMAEMALATPPYRGRSKLASPAPAAGAPDTATSSQPA
jgi:CPA2 family monovalent cation:H+ antiporter-2